MTKIIYVRYRGELRSQKRVDEWKSGPRSIPKDYNEYDFWSDEGVYRNSRKHKAYAVLAFSCLLLQQNTSRTKILEDLVSVGLSIFDSKKLLGKASGGCKESIQLIYRMIKIHIKNSHIFLMDWDKFSLPLEILEKIIMNSEKLAMQPVLKKFSAASIIWHYWKVFNMVQKNGECNGMECNQCFTLTYRLRRVKLLHNGKIYEQPVTENNYDDDIELGHTWFCYECYDNHVFNEYLGSSCSCGEICYY